ncbi:MAG TPA: glycosyltransferase family 39 protein [Bryobacteraceae bacterium]|nr:glycosyltransferase family 39 protein [Bryobacteraceae bacterium]
MRLLIALLVVRLWIMPLANSFWLDEAIIANNVREGLRHIFTTQLIALQSVAFCVVEWLVAQAAGTSEIALRLPSLLAAIGAVFAIYRLGKEVADSNAGLLCALLFVTRPDLAIQVPNARPYALALLCHIAAMLWLARWMREPRVKYAALWLACAVAATHLHHLFGVALALECAVALLCVQRHMRAARLKQLIIGITAAVLLLLPALPQAMVFFEHRKLLSFTSRPGIGNLIATLAPWYVLLPLALTTVLALLAGHRPRSAKPAGDSRGLILAVAVGLVPAVGFFLLSTLTDARLFSTRYLLPAMPGIVLFWGLLLRRIEPLGVPRVALAAAAVLVALQLGGLQPVPDYRGEDWRAAVNALPESGDLLVYSGLVECRRLDWLQDPFRWKYLASPLLAYRPAADPRATHLLPFQMAEADTSYADRLVSGRLAGSRRVAVLAIRRFDGPGWVNWVAVRLRSAGFVERRRSHYRAIEVAVFER